MPPPPHRQALVQPDIAICLPLGLCKETVKKSVSTNPSMQHSKLIIIKKKTEYLKTYTHIAESMPHQNIALSLFN